MKTLNFVVMIILFLFLISLSTSQSFGYNYLDTSVRDYSVVSNISYVTSNNSIYWNGNLWDDNRWLLLDASNDPITADLEIRKPIGNEVDLRLGIDSDYGILQYIKSMDALYLKDATTMVDSLMSIGNIETTANLTAYYIKNITSLEFNHGGEFITTIEESGGHAILLRSTDSLSEGGFPFIFVANDSNGDTIIPSWLQVGRNNSFSGNMNSFGLIPKSWVTFTGNESNGITFLKERSDYIEYCDYMKNNLSLIPNGCQYYADTTGRKVPLLFGGDLEIHRTATIHEGLTGFGFFSWLDNKGNDFQVLNSTIHLISNKRIQTVSNETIVNDVINWDGMPTGTDISPFVRVTDNSAFRDWRLVNDGTYCITNPCMRAKGGNGNLERISKLDIDFTNITNINLSFMQGIEMNILENTEITLNITDNDGNWTTIYNDTFIINQNPTKYSFQLLSTYWNKSSVTFYFTWSGDNRNDMVYIDDFTLDGIINANTDFNYTQLDGLIEFGDGECNINVTGDFYGNEMDINCPNIKFNNLKNNYTGGSAYLCVYDNGSIYTSESGC